MLTPEIQGGIQTKTRSDDQKDAHTETETPYQTGCIRNSGKTRAPALSGMESPISNAPFPGTATITETNTNPAPITMLMAPMDHAPDLTLALADLTVPLLLRPWSLIS